MNDAEEYLDSRQVAARLDERVRLISTWAKDGKIEAEKAEDGTWRIPKSEVQRIEDERFERYRKDKPLRSRTG